MNVRARGLVGVAIVLSLGTSLWAYAQDVHTWIAREAALVYFDEVGWHELVVYLGNINKHSDANEVLWDVWLGIDPNDELAWKGTSFIEGAYEEDASGVWFRHFVHEANGLRDGLEYNPLQDGPVWTHLAHGMPERRVQEVRESEGEYFSAYEAAEITFTTAVEQYGVGNLDLAYYWLGRTAHLLMDMTVPVHVHAVRHPKELGLGDKYEVQTDWKGFAGYENPYYYQNYGLDTVHSPQSSRIRKYPNHLGQEQARHELESLFRYTIAYTAEYPSLEDVDIVPGRSVTSVGKDSLDVEDDDRHKSRDVEGLLRHNIWGQLYIDDDDIDTYMAILANDLMPFVMEQTASLIAVFYATVGIGPGQAFVITATSGNNGQVEPSGEVSVTKEDSITFHATADLGYVVDCWYLDGHAVNGGNDSLVISNVLSNRDVLVTFKPDVANGALTHNGPWSATAGETFAINGYLHDALGDSVDGAKVYARINSSSIGQAVTDASGYYSMSNALSPSTVGQFTVSLEALYQGQSTNASSILTVEAVDTEVHPIVDADEFLTWVTNSANYNKKFKLTADIDLEGKGDNADGTFSTAIATFGGRAFIGRFDGRGFRIRHVKIDTKGASGDYLGLFAQLGSGGRILNLKLTSGVAIKAGSGSHYVGGMVGYNNDGYITECEISGNDIIAGDNCSCLGRLVGRDNHGLIVNCTVDGSVLCGAGSQSVGGLIGESLASDIRNCWATGNIRGHENSQYLGGLIGDANECTVSHSYATGWIEGRENCAYLGGLIGGAYDDCAINRCYATGEVRSDESDDDMAYAGGLAGYLEDSNISESYSTSPINTPDTTYVGGLTGWNQNNASIVQSYYDGSVTGAEYTGGIAGKLFDDCSIEDAYVKGTVTGKDVVAGIAGKNQAACSISNCYSVAVVTGSSYVGGIIGDNYQSTVSGCFFLNASAPDNSYGVVLTGDQMKRQMSYSGWDFSTVWSIREGIDYPNLSWDQAYIGVPTNVLASDDRVAYVLVEWDAASNAGFYRVYRSLNESDTKTAVSDWMDGLSYVDGTAEPGITYYYWVTAAEDLSGAGESEFSDSDTGYRVPSYTLAASVDGTGGSISPTTGTYSKGEVITLIAIADSGYQVKAWTGTDDNSSTATTNTVTMTSDKTVTVEFELIPPGDGLVAHFPFDGDVEEVTGYSNDGVNNGSTDTEDRFGEPNAARHFTDGQYVRVPRSAAIEPADAITVVLWARLTDPGYYDQLPIICKRYNVNTPLCNSYLLQPIDSPDFNMTAQIIVGGSQLSTDATNAMEPYVWTHEALVYDGTSLKVYQDGQLVAQCPASGSLDYSSDDLYIGIATPQRPLQHWEGDIDDVRIYNRALSASEVQELSGRTLVIGGAVYTDRANPMATGLTGVTMTVTGNNGVYEGVTSGAAGLWQISGVHEGSYTVTPSKSGWVFEHMVAGVPDGQSSTTIEVNEANLSANQSIQFLAQAGVSARLHDWNGDGIVSIVGDVPPFVQCVYFGNYPDGVGTIDVGDCNGDGILSIVGDVPCFVQCVYFNNCPE